MRAKHIFAIGAMLAMALVAAAHAAARHQAPQATRTDASAHAQKSPGGASSLRSETRLITVDVSVRDAHGKPVRGLKASDFRIFDDGRGPQQIAAFRFIEPPAIEAATTVPENKRSRAAEKIAEAARKNDPVYSNQQLARLPVPPTAILVDPGSIAFHL